MPRSASGHPLRCALTRDTALGLINQALPQTPFGYVAEVTGGSFNTCYVAQSEQRHRVILRLAPTRNTPVFHNEIGLLRRETEILQSLPSMRQETPQVLYSDFTNAKIERDFVIHSFLDGIIWHDILDSFSRQQENLLWNEALAISDYLAVSQASRFGVPSPGASFPTWRLAIENMISGLLTDLSRYDLLFAEALRMPEIIDRLDPALVPVDTPSLVHGDLWPKNIMLPLDGKPRIAGLIDWERSYWGDPLSAWILISSAMGGQFPRAGYIYRCSITSADYEEVPREPFQHILPADGASQLRNHLYYLCFLLLRRLEQHRFPRIEDWLYVEFVSTLADIRRLL
jgi:aminoglycoside phosphotransferase (APT) family kinase protein